MINKLNPLKRRSFLKTGIGGGALLFVSPLEIFFSSDVSKPLHTKNPGHVLLADSGERFAAVLEKYGSEFGQIGRRGNGGI